MEPAQRVVADPNPPLHKHDEPEKPFCFGCFTRPPRKPCKLVKLTPSQVQDRAKVDTEDYRNPFSKLDPAHPAEVLLCTACRSQSSGWYAMCHTKILGRLKVRRFIQAWKARAGSETKNAATKRCFICTTLEVAGQKCFQSSAQSAQRSPTRNLALFNLALYSERMRQAFFDKFCALSRADVSSVERLIQCPAQLYLCHVHINHSRYARNAATAVDDRLVGCVGGHCIFRGSGCAETGSRLRPLSSFAENTLESGEKFYIFDDAVKEHSMGPLDATQIQEKHACSQCLWIITQGQMGNRPCADLASLHDLTDIWLVRCIFFAFSDNPDISLFAVGGHDCSDTLRGAAYSLKESVIEVTSNIPILPFNCVVKCRDTLTTVSQHAESKGIDRRTIVQRISHILAARNIHLMKFGARTRCYVRGGSFESLVSSTLFARVRVTGKSLSDKDRSMLLDQVGTQFSDRREKYWEGNWNLNDEISSTPAALWRSFILQMASATKVSTWHIAAVACGKTLSEVFPVSNSADVMPHSIEECLSDRRTEYTRSDLLLCVRTLKVIEQLVFSRTNSVAGPITVYVSIANIVESSPSFVSVQNSLGLCVSYSKTESYRLRLISERERAVRGAWETISLGENEPIPTCQFDNWDILPLHSVKADGKALPKVNGSLLQGVSRKRKRNGNTSTMHPSSKRRMLEWGHPRLLGSREDFANSFTSKEKCVTLEEFSDIVFGLVCTHRDKLLSSATSATSNNTSAGGCTSGTSNRQSLKDVINFRSLLLSAFKPHGGTQEKDDDDLYEQQVVYVDISRENAADVLTVRRTPDLVRNLLRPGQPGCPRFVVVAGDQPSYKMLVELWLSSRRDFHDSHCSPHSDAHNLPLHEWLIPFPGFFHAEKQAMYSLCKEMLDGVGLQELAECAGLSLAQVKNILKHGHARNNRAFLFSLTCALMVHLIDTVRTELPEVWGES